MRIGDEVYIHGYVDEIRKDTIIIRNEGGYFGTVPSEVGLKVDMVDVLDKIRAEIEEQYGNYDICEWFEDYDYDENNISEYRSVGSVSDILAIIDKYKAESEDKECCKNCKYNHRLKHNFEVNKGFEESFCCDVLMKGEPGGWIQEVSPNDRCEMFEERDKYEK